MYSSCNTHSNSEFSPIISIENATQFCIVSQYYRKLYQCVKRVDGTVNEL